MKTFAWIALVLVACVSTASAAPIVTLGVTTAGTNWYLWCQVDGQSAGLTTFDVDLDGIGGRQILTSTVKAPAYLAQGTNASTGFQTFRRSGVIAGGNAIGISAMQVTMYGDTNIPTSDARVIQRFGYWAGSATDATGATVSWAAQALLAQGTFSGSGSFTVQPVILNVLTKTGDSWVGPGNVEGADYRFAGVRTCLAGDCNMDGWVKFADYLTIEQNFGKSGKTWADGDFTGDGWVKFADYLLLEQGCGKHADWAVPEPATLSLLVLGGIALRKRRGA